MVERDALQTAFHGRADGKRFRNRLDNPFIRAKERRLAALVAGRMPPGGRELLELGCGEGSNLVYLYRALPRAGLLGLDYSAAKVRFLKARFPAARPVCADARALPLRGASFDLVLCRDLLHHLPGAGDQVVGEALRVLRPGGRLLILESRGTTLLNRLFQRLVPAERGMAGNTPSNLLALGRSHGPAELEFVEASQALRAAAYPFGWPAGWGRLAVGPACLAAWAWERLFEALAPRTAWTTMMLTIRKD